MIALVASSVAGAGPLADRLRADGPPPVSVECRPVGRGRVLVYATYATEPDATSVVAALRRDGHHAMFRPPAGGRLVAWTNTTRPVQVTARLCVAFPWSEFDRSAIDPGVAIVEIDPGAAFGAGSHPSTRLLLAELAGRLTGVETVLDVGCGSGVLAVAAAALGATSVCAVDIEPAAQAATVANAAWNGVAGRVDVSTTPLADVAGRFAVVVANIGAGALAAMATDLWDRVEPGGWLGLSGLSPAQLSVVGAAFPTAARVLATPRLDDWAALVLARP